MIRQEWSTAVGKHLVCVDSYENSVLKGRLYDPEWGVEPFSSLSQFLVKMEQILDRKKSPQGYTETRRFSTLLQPEEPGNCSGTVRKGSRATFELRVIFRQHTSWQGILQWREQDTEHSFRSVLELVILMDSALRCLEGSGAA